MQQGSPEWIDLKILNSLDRLWNRKGKYLSAFELTGYLAQQGYCVALETVTERLRTLHQYGLIEAQYAPNGTGPNAPMQLRYSRIRARC
jgi:hypothetical protein